MNTIAAISTAMGAGGIGIIRMSGKECFDILDKIFEPAKKENIDKIPRQHHRGISLIQMSVTGPGHIMVPRNNILSLNF